MAFIGRHFMLAKVRGRFTGVDGAITVGDAPNASSVEVTIDVASVDSGDDTRDEHLRSADLFDVDNHPTAVFRSTSVDVEGTSGTVTGELRLKGRARPISLRVDYLGFATDPWGNERAVFSARTRLNREDWGVSWNLVLDSGGLLVSKEIDLEIELEAIRER